MIELLGEAQKIQRIVTNNLDSWGLTMNKVMITGLALGLETKACQACNFDFEWLLRYPSVLVWADKIVVTKEIWDVITEKNIPDADIEFSNSLKLIFEIAGSEKIIEVLDSTGILTSDLTENIFHEVEKDRELLAKNFPKLVTLGDDEKVPGQIFINGTEYCVPNIWTIYAALILARAWDTHCLFSEQTLNFCRFKFGLTNFPEKGEQGSFEAFETIFDAYIPNIELFPEYTFMDKELCAKCAKEESCKDTYLSKIETNVKNILSIRSYDEIIQLKSFVDRIVNKRKEGDGILNPDEIVNEFRQEENKIRKRLKVVFPKVKRWTNITTLASIPVVVAGIGTGYPLITLSGAALTGLSQASKELLNLLSSKYSWIGFSKKNIELHR